MRYLLLVIVLFQLQTVIGQSIASPRSNTFTDVTRDSILSKLLQRDALAKKYKALRLVVHFQDSTIIQYAEKSRLQENNRIDLNSIIYKKDTIIFNHKKLTVIEKKKGRKRTIIIGGSALLLGFIVGSVF